MPIEITPLYAAPLAVLYFGLVVRVVLLRRKHRVGIGDGGQRDLAKAIRAHGNAAETIPIVLLVMLVAELTGVGTTMLHTVGAMLLVGRFGHAYGLSLHSGTSPGRVVGMVLSMVALLMAAGAALVKVL